jgi:iron complex transport system substrate-binding protein
MFGYIRILHTDGSDRRRNHRRIISLVLAFWAIFGVAASLAAQTGVGSATGTGAGKAVSAVDSLGRTIVLKSAAQRVVSLTPTATEILFAVGAGGQTVGATKFCNYPAEALALPKVGGFSGATVSAEQIVALKPDLVLVSGGMHGKIIGLLNSLGVTNFALEPTTFSQVYDNILAVGTLTGRTAEAEKTVQSMKSRIAAVVKLKEGKPRPGVFWELWDDPLMTAGGSTFLSEAIGLAGGRNIFADMGEQWPTVGLEQILVRKPEWIIAGDDHGDRANLTVVSKRPGWAAVPAVRSGQIATIDSDIITRAGPRLADAVEALASILK